MRIFFDNIDIRSSSGPNSFGRKLMFEMIRRGHEVETSHKNGNFFDRQLSFIHTTHRAAQKVALRLDGIYFNTRQDWESLNIPIRVSHESADLVVYQSKFNKELTERYFGEKKNSVIINNGTDLQSISEVPPANHPALDKYSEIWCCSSSWRPHKRLKDNISYFRNHAPENSLLIVLGDNPDHIVDYSNVMYVGNQSWKTCISIYKRSKKFLHLAFLDHCPNVVVDARACGCEIIVSSSGGTKEVAGPEALLIQDIEWDMSPLDLYAPPPLDFNASRRSGLESNIDIKTIAEKYIDSIVGIQ